MMKKAHERIEPLLKRWSFAPESPEGSAVAQRETFWRFAYRHWMKFARALGKANAVVFLTIIYIALFGPVALVLKIFGKDLLDRKAGKDASFWYDKEKDTLTQERSEHQF